MMVPAPDTIAAIATPSGRGGVGIIRVSGPAASAIATAILERELPPRVATVATFLGAKREPLDQGLALFFPAPHSYTGEPVIELHGHGGPVVLRLLLARCIELGARLVAGRVRHPVFHLARVGRRTHRHEQVAVGVYGDTSVTPIMLLRNPQHQTPQMLSNNDNLTNYNLLQVDLLLQWTSANGRTRTRQLSAVFGKGNIGP